MRSLGEATYLKIAGEHGISEDEVKAVLAEKRYEDRINEEMAMGRANGVRGTPASFVNGEFLSGAKPYEDFKAAVEKALGNPPGAAAADAGGEKKDDDQAAAPEADADTPMVAVGDAPTLGPDDADVTVLTYSDFQ